MVADSSARRVKPAATRIRAMLHRTLSANAEHAPAAATAGVSAPAPSRNPAVAKDARLPMRLPEALKQEFEWAAKQEGFRGASAWLRALGEERCEQLLAADGNERAINEPVLDAFVPGFGLDEED